MLFADKQTNTHYDLLKTEISLTHKLTRFYNREIKIQNSTYPIEHLKRKHASRIRNLIRHTLEKPSILARKIAGDYQWQRDPDFLLFTSGRDIDLVKQMEARLNEKFWNTVAKLSYSQITAFGGGGNSAELHQLGNEKIKAAMTIVSAYGVYSTYNHAVVSKLNSLEQSQSPDTPTIDLVSRSAANVRTLAALEGRGGGRRTGGSNTHVMFRTKRDAKVDPQICAPLNGTTWAIDDPSITIPPDDTHPNCRCILFPLDLSEESSLRKFAE